ncbi:Efflux pump membrane transporter BepE [Aquicella siphonis]|uniref:Efflux pump membrane transporter BepE n=1 Tax=Aquicella siphonis TaxID=254247 RepID=A0A5E4PGA8_9COXI|nr:efflux RND transporter permease subunit [Aquicella siphonis]VVC75894.1 Efflux pump membrane transporter BepE [Aquicella siphonis]
MNLPAFCIKRPAFTIVISLVMTIIGLIGFMNLPVRWIPNVNPPQIAISTSYPGANARLVERDVTKVIEDTLSGINGIEMLTSTSRQGESQISITFKLGRNMDAAVEDVRSSLERVRGSLPKDSLNPIVTKADPNTDAIMYISFNDSHRSERELSDYIDKFVVPSFETIDGVGSVWVYGKRISAMRIWLDPAKLAAANVTVDEVAQLLRDQNISIPSGQILANDRYYSVVTDTTLKSAEQFNDLIIRNTQNQMVRLKDIGEARLDVEDTDSAFRINGKPGIALGIVPQSTANPLDVEDQVQKSFAELKRTLPDGMQASIIYNQADYIRASIHSVYESFIEAVLFVWLVILAFLCSFRATLIPIITIPVCMISTFALLYFLGFSINTITLMAFVLAIGLVVDDAIVMLENISRHMEEGMSAFQAALKGSQEIIFPIIAMTLTLAAVYTPIAFTPGLLGVLFREFTFTLAGAVIVSGVVALTLSPMMCARILNKVNYDNRYGRWQTRQLSRIQSGYQNILGVLLSRRKWVAACLILAAAMGLGTYKFLSSELAPAEDMNNIYVSIAAPRSASFQYTDKYVKQMEALYQQVPEIESYLSMSGMRSPSHSFQILTLKPRNQRARSTDEIVSALTSESSQISGVRVNIFTPPPPLTEVAGGDDGDNLGLVLMTTSDYRKLQQTTKQMVDALKEKPQFAHVDNSLKWDSEQFQVNIDRDKAADLRVPIPSITSTLSTLIAGRIIGKMDESNVWLQMNKSSLADPNIFHQLYVRNDDSKMVPLSSMLTVSEASTSEVYKHYERLRSDMIYLTLAPAHKVSEAIKVLQTIAKDNLPDDMKFSFTGEAKSFLESSGKTAMTFLLALIFIYLVLVAQFESFIDPLVILFTVPFAVVGAMLTLKVFGGTLNIYSNIGLITLVGLIAKHGILITDFANRLRASGKSIHEAVVEASMLRLRPILMTTAAMVLGALPLAFAMGPGAESRQQVGLVIAGGMLFGTFFSLIVVPVTYTFLAPFRKVAVLTIEQEA